MKKFMFFWVVFKIRQLVRRRGDHIIVPMVYVSYQHKFSYYYISKNACTTMKGIIHSECCNQILTANISKHSIHSKTKELISKGYIFYCNRKQKNKNLDINDKIKFMVYRDPVERFVSAYKELVYEMTASKGYHYLQRVYKQSKKTNFTVDDGITLVRYENLFVPYFAEQHIAKQSLYYNRYKKFCIDYLVNIKNLDKFLDEVIGLKSFPRLNTDTKNMTVSLSQDQIKQIKNIYKDDYKILEDFKGNKSYI